MTKIVFVAVEAVEAVATVVVVEVVVAVERGCPKWRGRTQGRSIW